MFEYQSFENDTLLNKKPVERETQEGIRYGAIGCPFK